MKSRAWHRLGCALWLGLLALTVSGIEQNRLSLNVLNASLTAHNHSHSSGHIMPDGTFMVGAMHTGGEHTDPATHGGHSHKGHADCGLCGVVAATASFTPAQPALLLLPIARAVIAYRSAEQDIALAKQRAAFLSRGPPSVLA